MSARRLVIGTPFLKDTASPYSEYTGVLRLLRWVFPDPSDLTYQAQVRGLRDPRSFSQVLARFVFCHAMLYDSADVSGTLAVNVPLLVAFPEFRPGRPSDYTLTKLNRFTPEGYGLDITLFTLCPRAPGLGPKTRFSAESRSLRRQELHRLETISLSWSTES